MSDREELEKKEAVPPEREPDSKGPSLALLYALIGIALLAATGLALLIVRPFYEHRR